MNHLRSIIRFGLSTVLLTLVFSKGNLPDREEVVSKLIRYTIENVHYSEPVFDDDFSERSFSLFLKRIDYNKRFFLKSDVEIFNEYQYKIDDEFLNAELNFFNLAWGIFDKRIADVQAIIDSILVSEIDFDKKDYLEFDVEKRDFPANKFELVSLWEKYIKRDIYARYQEIAKEQTEDDDSAYKKLTKKIDSEILAEAIEQVKKTQNRRMKRIREQDENTKFSLYLNSMTNSIDPHTTYLAPEVKEDFDIRMSGQFEGIGARLMEDDGYIKVSEIIPGGAAWRQGQLQAEDLILKVAQGEDEPLDIIEMRVREAVNYIRGEKGTVVKLTTKKPDGQIVIIPITRDVVVIEETYAKSAVIENKLNDDKIGYIFLPKFYHDFKKTGAQNAAEDVKMELEKLKLQNVEGIILDLRNNGGGSLYEAIEMTGLFIEDGPVVQVRYNTDRTKLYKDEDKSVVYDGPLLILVNSYSASASEILAAAIQDYGRAVIVGSPNTFGKGTVQNLFDLDRKLNPALSELKPIGTLKLTFQKFYRIDGGSTQYKGVIPDIVIPDFIDYLEIGEEFREFPLVWDTIDSVKHDWINSNTNYEELRQNSEKRIADDSRFNILINRNKDLEERMEDTYVDLRFKKYFSKQRKLEKLTDKYDDIDEEFEHIIILDDITLEEIDDEDMRAEKEEQIKEWHKDIRKDIVLNEALNILHDVIISP